MTYRPRPENQALLNYAMAKIRSVPYRVSARWVFYQLVQAGFIGKKKVDKFYYLLSRARKRFWKDWRPDTLTDSIRKCHFKGEEYVYFDLGLDSIGEQECYVQLWFEAEAMHEQFEYYTKDYRVSLVPFRGDCSIPIKWEIAKKIEAMALKYRKPVQILYYGDYDEKGIQIYLAALKDILAWSNIGFNVESVGLTLEQARKMKIPENPLKPNTYQWEALNDEQAGSLILKGLEKYQHKVSENMLNREKDLQERIVNKIKVMLKE